MEHKKTYIVGIVVIAVVVFGFAAAVCYDIAYRQGVEDTEQTEQDPTPCRLSTMVITLNASQYNQTWYEIGRGYDVSEEVRSPTLHNDSFLVMIGVYWGSSDTYGGQVGAPIPHANITMEVLSFGYEWHNYTTERVAISGYNLTESRKMVNFYNNTAARMHATDGMSVAFFGYGSYNDEIVFWVLQSIILTVGPVWYEEVTQ